MGVSGFRTSSLIKVATFWLEMTVALTFLMPKMDSGSLILRLSLTLRWQDRRFPASLSFRDRLANSVGRMLPPPSMISHLHMPQDPDPPQAEGRKIFSLDRAVKSGGLPGMVRAL